MKGQSLLFDCCSRFQPVSNQETLDYSLIKSMNMKGKKIKLSCFPHSPKSSLRMITSKKMLQNTQSVSGYNSINLAQTVDHHWRFAPQTQNSVVQRKVPHVQVNNTIAFQHQTFLHKLPSPVEADHLLLKNKSHNIFEANKIQSRKSETVMPEQSEKQNQINASGKSKSAQFEHFQSKQSINMTPNNQKQFQIPSTKKSSNDRKTSFKSKPSLKWSELGLGQSKMTYLSQGDNDNSIDLDDSHLEESLIVVNVFNPTSSQIKKWDIGQIRKSNQ